MFLSGYWFGYTKTNITGQYASLDRFIAYRNALQKKEPAPQKEMRTSEIKKVRKRISMKAKLAEKKAEIAERDKKPTEVDKSKKPPDRYCSASFTKQLQVDFLRNVVYNDKLRGKA